MLGRKLLFGIVVLGLALVPAGLAWAQESAPEEDAAMSGVIAYPSFDNDATQMKYNIWALDMASGKKELLLENASQPAFSHDGKSIAYKNWTEDRNVYGLYSAALDDMKGSVWRFSDSVADQRPKWSPDDAFFQYYSRRESDRENRIMATEAAWTSGHTIQRPDLQNKEILGRSPDVVLLKKDTYAVLYQGCEANDCGVMKRSIDGTTPEQVTDNTTDQALSVSPDSKHLAFMSYSRNDDWEIYVMNADGTNVKRITRNPGTDGLPAWSPDGKWIAFVREKHPDSNDWALMAVRADGTDERKVGDIGMLNGMSKGTTPDQCGGWLDEQISWGTMLP